MIQLQDVNIKHLNVLPSPEEIKKQVPSNEQGRNTVAESREVIKSILNRQDSRLLVIAGPCSIHDIDAAMKYAEGLLKLKEQVKDSIFLMMRVYFEKPRTTVGWKGLINDPYLDESFDVVAGIKKARSLLVNLTNMGIPVATEFLDPITPQYIANMVSWAAIGARTTESQIHREMTSGLSMPVGFKNGTEGNLQICLDAIAASQRQHTFMGINQQGLGSVVKTTGNEWCHVVLRGGKESPNYKKKYVQDALKKIKEAHLNPSIMVDCSHANSNKDYSKQSIVWKDVIEQRLKGQKELIGMMLESNLYEGSQSFNSGTSVSDLKYGVSITDACIGWEQTEDLLLSTHQQILNS